MLNIDVFRKKKVVHLFLDIIFNIYIRSRVLDVAFMFISTNTTACIICNPFFYIRLTQTKCFWNVIRISWTLGKSRKSNCFSEHSVSDRLLKVIRYWNWNKGFLPLGPFVFHTYFVTEYPLIMIILDDPWHSYCRVFDRVGVTTCSNDLGIPWLGFPFIKLLF